MVFDNTVSYIHLNQINLQDKYCDQKFLQYISTVQKKTFPLLLFDFFQFEQADEATRNRRALEIEKEDTDELQQKYQVGSFVWIIHCLVLILPVMLPVMDYMERLCPKWEGIS